ncbi:MAG: ATP-binding cassette domain-containing protein [Candidatus Poseidoniales archaeon]|nr:MAG: ATP-binding cassette domain-containing protein [Candidatus Poseidoniales archaeon]
MDDEAMLSTRGLSVGYDHALVSDIDLDVFPGDIIGIIGASGIGKTTILRTLAGLIPPFQGNLEHSLVKNGELGYIPQRLGLVRHASVEHNVALGARATARKPPEGTSSVRQWKATVTHEAIKAMGLTEKTREPVRRLSGGQQRRTATARTLAQRPRIILADEFLSELDAENVEMVFGAIHRLVKEDGSALVVVEHNVERAFRYCTRVLRVRDGRLHPVQGGESE